VKWIFDRTVGKILTPLLNALGVQALADRLTAQLKKAIGLDDLKQKLMKLVDPLVQKVTAQLQLLDDDSVLGPRILKVRCLLGALNILTRCQARELGGSIP
jgi:hypothetical protein